jgi:hypothetical protein
MAWRPSNYLLEGELDNTQPGKVTGWTRFAGLKEQVTFDLEGNFHRDIRGAKIRFRGDGQSADPDSSAYFDGFSLKQTGNVGDITAGRAPADYTEYPYIEWYSEQNGRVVLELDPEQVEVIGKPIPACESDPIPREQQAQNMAAFLGGLSKQLGVPAIAVGGATPIISDPAFTHWVVEQGHIIGEAHLVQSEGNGRCFAFVRLFGMPENAEYGTILSRNIIAKSMLPLS